MSLMSLQGDGEPLKILSGVGNVQWFLQEKEDGPTLSLRYWSPGLPLNFPEIIARQS